jgi:hypothetical protein
MPPGWYPGMMPTPPPPQPTPAASPAVKKEPVAPATYSGSVKIAVYSEAIFTGDANPKFAIDFDRVESILKRVPGVGGASRDDSNRSIVVEYAGLWSDLNRLSAALNTNAISSELISPARVVYRPMAAVEDASRAIAAIQAISGVHHVSHENGDFRIYADLTCVGLGPIKAACDGAGVKGMFASHEEVKVSSGAAGQGDPSALREDLLRTKWVLNVQVDGGSVTVLAVKGRVTRALIKSLMAKHGYSTRK